MQTSDKDKKSFENDYIFDNDLAIWLKPEFKGIAYSDGDEIETYIGTLIREANDVSLFSPDLIAKCKDWTTTYHLSPSRSNIMRPFSDRLPGAEVLEIGAGCGAITRYLGEIGAQTLALEGSIRRAAIARERTRDLENVKIFSDDIMAFETDKRFDFVTLIGVLEYANMFSDSLDPAVDLLRKAHSLLKPDGQVLIAIENQLGLKYFVGAPEDHLGIPFYGIEGHYQRNQVETFGRLTLQRKLLKAGFADQRILLPLPDYKFPSSILTENALSDEYFDPSAFFWLNAAKDRQNPSLPAFSQELVWEELLRNGLGRDFSNSFLCIGSPSPIPSHKQEKLAWHFSAGRKSEFCKTTTFYHTSNADILVEVSRLDGDTSPLAAGEISYNPQKFSTYVKGKTLDREFGRLASRDVFDMNLTCEYFKKYISIIRDIERREELPNQDNKSVHYSLKVSGELIDAVPRNLIMRDEGNPIFFDREWATKVSQPVGYMIYRSLLTLFDTLSVVGTPSVADIRTFGQLLIYILDALDLPSDQKEIQYYIEKESQLCEVVFGESRIDILQQRLGDRLPMRGHMTLNDRLKPSQEILIPETLNVQRRDESVIQKFVRRIKRKISQILN